MRESRQLKLQQICSKRRITTLMHFTRIENLSSILQQGLLGRNILEERGQDFEWNDSQRLDEHKEAVCLSISFPNYRMFYSIRERKKETNEANDSQWVVLLLDAKVLWELDCAFYQENAASNPADGITPSLEQRKTSSALTSMFVEDYVNRQGSRVLRQVLQISNNYPTNPQAEVLVFDSIPTRYIKIVHFRNATILREWRSINSETYSQMLTSSSHYFNPRHDWAAWQRDNLDSDEIPEVNEPPGSSFEPDDIPF